MPNRRRFLQSFLAMPVLALPAVPPALACATRNGTAGARLERFVFDDRFPEALTLAHRAARAGTSLARISGDLMDLWYHDLDLRWRQAPMTLGGITTRSDLFVLETFALDRRMRVVYRAEHGQALVSWLIAPSRAGRTGEAMF